MCAWASPRAACAPFPKSAVERVATIGRLRGLFFDFDGTVAETERFGHRVAFNRAFAELGLDWFWDEALYGELLAVAGGNERLQHYVERERPRELAQVRASGLLERIHSVKTRHFAALAPEIPLRPGVARLVHEARALGVTVAIATTAARPGVEALLGREPALREAIAFVASGEAVERKKPAPDAYHLTMETLGLRPEACVAIEDSSVGLRAALAAGITTLVTTAEYTAREDFSGAAAVVSELGEPGRPARHSAGPVPAQGFVDVAYLEELLRRTRP